MKSIIEDVLKGNATITSRTVTFSQAKELRDLIHKTSFRLMCSLIHLQGGGVQLFITSDQYKVR